MKKIIPLSLIILLFISACSKTKKDYWPNGNIKSELKYSNDKLDGYCCWYYDNGTKQMECQYNNNLINGTLIRWYPNGVKQSEALYINNKLNGVSKTWYKNGKILSEEHFINDTLNGQTTTWHENGKIKIKGYYKKGLFQGQWIYYDKNGFKVGEGNFHMGTGIQKGYYRNGQIKRIINYVQNRKEGKETWFNENKNPIREMVYKNDTLVSTVQFSN